MAILSLLAYLLFGVGHAQEIEFPSKDELRYFRGDLAGIHIPELKTVPGGTSDVLFTPIYPCYPPEIRTKIREEYRSRGYTHFPIMLPDGRGYHGIYPTCGDWSSRTKDFRDILLELWSDGIIPVVFMIPDMSLEGQPPSEALPKIKERMKTFMADKETLKLIKVAAVAWEPLNGWMTPKTFTAAAKWLKSELAPDTLLYAHFTSGHAAGSDKDESESGWWKSMQGTLQGLLYQHDGNEGPKAFQDRLFDFTLRFGSGYHGWPTGLDVVAFEYSAYWEVNHGRPESWGISLGKAAIETTTKVYTEGSQSFTPARVMGFGDGGPFGPPPQPAKQCAVPVGKNVARVVEVSVNERFAAQEKGEAFVTVKNEGESVWSERFVFRLGSQGSRDNTLWRDGRVMLPPGVCVQPGEEYTFKFPIQAPSVAGTYAFQWQMLREHVEWFGRPSKPVQITVTGGAQAVPRPAKPGVGACSDTLDELSSDTYGVSDSRSLGHPKGTAKACYEKLALEQGIESPLDCLSAGDHLANRMNKLLAGLAESMNRPRYGAPGFAFTLPGCKAARAVLGTGGI